MVRRNLFHRDNVVTAALAVVQEHGFAQLSARRVADRLGSSTAPVYSNFASMEELARAVKLAIVGMVLDETMISRSGEPFLDMGIGVLEFARRQPELYNAVFMTPPEGADAAQLMMEELLDRTSRLENLAGLDPAERLILLRKLAIFTHGLAAHLTAGHADDFSWDEILTLLREAGQAMITDAFNRPPRSAAEIALLGNLCKQRDGRPACGPANDNPGETDDA